MEKGNEKIWTTTEGENKEMEEFLGEFGLFYKSILQNVGSIENEHIVTLYAIYKKNGRAEKLNGNGHKPEFGEMATEKQKDATNSL